MEKMISTVPTLVSSGIHRIASWMNSIRAVPWSSQRILIIAGLLLLLVALVAPGIPAKAYYRLPSDGGVFEPPVDLDWAGRHECIVHVMNQMTRGDYYLECPYANHRLLFWSPIIALSGVLLLSVAIRGTQGKPLVVSRFDPTVQILAGVEGMIVTFHSS